MWTEESPISRSEKMTQIGQFGGASQKLQNYSFPTPASLAICRSPSFTKMIETCRRCDEFCKALTGKACGTTHLNVVTPNCGSAQNVNSVSQRCEFLLLSIEMKALLLAIPPDDIPRLVGTLTFWAPRYHRSSLNKFVSSVCSS